jgi:tRNA-dihydrouridine synthase 3
MHDPAPWKGAALLAPLTRVGNLPYRRLCVRFGAQVTCSEMAYASEVVRGAPRERALLRHHPSEPFFGVQLAGRKHDKLAEAARIAVGEGARFIDLNCGCPIRDAVRRGMGSALLKQPTRLARAVEALVAAVDVPVTAKIRIGYKEGKINAPQVARLVEEAGAAALTVHGRTREQRYARTADWAVVAEIAAERNIPILGNGDVLTWYEAEDRLTDTPIAALMLARGALIKPWLFQELREGTEWCPSPTERVAVLLELTGYLRDHFGSDELGQKRTLMFLPHHLHWMARYHPLPASEWRARSHEHPLLQTRLSNYAGDDPLEQVLSSADDAIHTRLAALLWSAETVEDAVAAIPALLETGATPAD